MREASEQDTQPDEMRGEYDFSGGVRGKYAERYAGGASTPSPAPEAAESGPPDGERNALPQDVPPEPS